MDIAVEDEALRRVYKTRGQEVVALDRRLCRRGGLADSADARPRRHATAPTSRIAVIHPDEVGSSGPGGADAPLRLPFPGCSSIPGTAGAQRRPADAANGMSAAIR